MQKIKRYITQSKFFFQKLLPGVQVILRYSDDKWNVDTRTKEAATCKWGTKRNLLEIINEFVGDIMFTKITETLDKE